MTTLIRVEPLALATHSPRAGSLIAICYEVARWERPEGVEAESFLTPLLNEVVVVMRIPSVTPDQMWGHIAWTAPLDRVHDELTAVAATLMQPGRCYVPELTKFSTILNRAAHVFEANVRWIGVRRRTRARQTTI